MADIMSPAARSRVMSRIRCKDTTPERYIDELLRAASLSYERHAKDLPGSPDFVFRDHQVAVFVDGDFWHGWRFPLWEHKLDHFWQEKIRRNRQRDESTHRKLRRRGWKVIRLWEHQIESDVMQCVRRVVASLPIKRIPWTKIDAVCQSMPPLIRRRRLPRP